MSVGIEATELDTDLIFWLRTLGIETETLAVDVFEDFDINAIPVNAPTAAGSAFGRAGLPSASVLGLDLSFTADEFEFGRPDGASTAGVDALEGVESQVGGAIALTTANFGTLTDNDIPTAGPSNGLLGFLDAKGGEKGKPGGKPDPEPEPEPEPSGPTAPVFSYISGQTDAGRFDYYNITIEFYGSLWGQSMDLVAAFEGAANFLSSIIETGLTSNTYWGSYFDTTQEIRTADDIVIEAYLSDIDGTGGVLGRAGPTYARSSDGTTIDGLTVAGIMEFDIADAQELLSGAELGGLWNDTVFHEMMHVLGFGTLWDFANWDLVGDTLTWDSDNGTKRPTDDQYHYDYTGNANTLYDEEFIPVEANGGSGTARGHWDELLLENEIMTGYINIGGNVLKDYTIAALEDLGYDLVGDNGTVNYTQMALDGTAFLAWDDIA